MAERIKNHLLNNQLIYLAVLLVSVTLWITNSIWGVRADVQNVRSDVRLLQRELDDFKQNGSGPIKEVQKTVNQLTTDLRIHMAQPIKP